MTTIPATIQIPHKIQWIVDLTSPSANTLSPKVMKAIAHGPYANINFRVLEADKIWDLFFPHYVKLIMDREDFRLDKAETIAKIKALSQDPGGRLLWFSDPQDNVMLGGVTLHLYPSRISIAYRCFDHALATSLGLKMIDYYAELKTREYAQSLNYAMLSHGRDNHPVNQLGLSTWKLRNGAKPARSRSAIDIEYTSPQLQQLAQPHGVAGYYDAPVNDVYTQFHLYGDRISDATTSFIKVAQRSGITVIFADGTQA